MLRLYTSPRTPVENSRRLPKRAANGAPVTISSCAAPLRPLISTDEAGAMAPTLSSALPKPAAWSQTKVCTGNSVYDLHGNELRPTRTGLVAAGEGGERQPPPTDSVPSAERAAAVKWGVTSSSPSLIASLGSPSAAVSVRKQAAIEAAMLSEVSETTMLVDEMVTRSCAPMAMA